MTAPVLNQSILFKISSSPARTVPAVVSLVIDADTVDLVAFADINDTAQWPLGTAIGVPTYNHASWLFTGVARGTGVGEWQDAAIPPPISDAIASAVTTGTTGLASTTYADTGDAGRCAMPGAGSDPGLAANTARRPSTTRPTLVTVSGSWAWSLNAIGSTSSTVVLKSDSSGTPTTARHTAAFARGISVGITVGDTGTVPFSCTYPVPAGHFYQVAVTGAGVTFAVQETTL